MEKLVPAVAAAALIYIIGFSDTAAGELFRLLIAEAFTRFVF